MRDLLFQSGEKVLFIGDSITDCERRDEHAPFGYGYVNKIVELITAKYPERQLQYVNKGIGGDVVEGLEERWHADVIVEQPDWISVSIGINNASRQVANSIPNDKYLPKWEACYRRILKRAQEELDVAFFAFEIFYVKEDVEQPRRLAVNAYNDIVHRLADEFDVRLVRTSEIFSRAVASRPAVLWTTQDGIHPNAVGHTMIALEFLKQAGW